MPHVRGGHRRTGLVVVVPAGELVGDFRRRHNAAAVAREVPPHVTILFPFVRAAAVVEGTRSRLTAHFSAFEPFEAELTHVGQFAGYVWLAPEPRDRFVDLITATVNRFPEHPPYELEGGEPEPHLTIAAVKEGDDIDRIAAEARAELAARLPFRFAVDAVSLLEEQTGGTWQESDRFRLG